MIAQHLRSFPSSPKVEAPCSLGETIWDTATDALGRVSLGESAESLLVGDEFASSSRSELAGKLPYRVHLGEYKFVQAPSSNFERIPARYLIRRIFDSGSFLQ
jgi:hypothetical protein